MKTRRKILSVALLGATLCWTPRAAAQTMVLHHADGRTTDVELYTKPRVTLAADKTIITSPVLNMEFPANDINGDGKVNVGDIMAIINIMASGDYNPAADINGDGKVNVGDIMAIINIMAGVTTPEPLTSCPDDNHPHMIDLGLPSGTKWACCNVGANAPEDYGDYYAWGETQPKSVYNWDTYQYGSSRDNVVNIGSDIAGTGYDAATANWGAPWRMPSLAQCRELINNCTSTWTTQNGVNGRKFTGPNGGTIFLPAAGSWGSELYFVGTNGNYWSSTLYESGPYGAYNLYFDSGDAYWDYYGYRSSGRSVRPVRCDTSCPDDNHPHMIDLGLPSGTKWACCNVGANAPEDYGDYCAWGETQPKSVYNWDTYQYGNSSDNVVNIGSDIAGTGYDAATANWGAPWRMPSLAQCQELINNCSSTWTTQNGVNGRKFTGPNGGTIFLPAAGLRWGSESDYVGTHGDYWSSTLFESNPIHAYYLGFRSGDANRYLNDRGHGQSVRPVRCDTSCPDDNHPHMIDLGLPSGTKWACCNVGASTPEDYGDYFAWGETQPKGVYDWDTYQYGSSWDNVVNIGSDIAGTGYDAATANWGAPWRMPSLAQCQELINNCSSAWTTQNGVNGRKFTGPNGGTIFLPAAGLRWGSELDYVGTHGYYWSSTLNENESYPDYACYLDFRSGRANWDIINRSFGQSVRPVR